MRLAPLVATLTLLACGCRAAGAQPREVVMAQAPRLEITAHRGASAEAPENTLAAFRRAAELGAHRVELDLRLSADGQVVVLHDATLERTTDGEGEVAARRWDELSDLDAGSWFSPAFAGERLPRLEDVLAWSAGRLPLNLELKTSYDVEATRELVRRTVEQLRQRELEGETQLSTFDPVAAAEAARACPRCEVALLWNGRSEPGPLELLAGLPGVRALHLPLGALDPALVEALRARGLRVRVYTVNDRPGLERALSLGVDGVISDVPAELLRWLDAEERRPGLVARPRPWQSRHQ